MVFKNLNFQNLFSYCKLNDDQSVPPKRGFPQIFEKICLKYPEENTPMYSHRCIEDR